MQKDGYGRRVAELSCYLTVDPLGVKRITQNKPSLSKGQLSVKVKVVIPIEAFDCQFLGEHNICIPVVSAEIE